MLVPSGERLQGKGKHGVILQVKLCVIHAWAPCVYYKKTTI